MFLTISVVEMLRQRILLSETRKFMQKIFGVFRSGSENFLLSFNIFLDVHIYFSNLKFQLPCALRITKTVTKINVLGLKLKVW